MPRIARLHARAIPSLNLPSSATGKHLEEKFCKKFARSFSNSEQTEGIGIREFQVPGHGIADFLWISTKIAKTKKNAQSISAFEMKLKDWKKGVSQAYRYSYFADSVYLVLPEKNLLPALSKADLFERLGIGLYSFNEMTNESKLVIMATNNGPRNQQARNKAEELLLRDFNLRFAF